VPAEGGEAHPHIQPGNLKITQEIMSRCFFGLTTEINHSVKFKILKSTGTVDRQ